MGGTVKSGTKIGIDERVAALRLQLVASTMGRRIGERIRQRRKELGLTQKQVAARMPSEAVDAQRISDWERAYNQPSQRYMEQLVEALEVPDVSYFYATGEKTTPPLLRALDGGGEEDQGADLIQLLTQIDRKLDEMRIEAETHAAEVRQQIAEMRQPARAPQRRQQQ